MPIYEYECADCGNFEKIEKVNEETTKQCPNCEKDATRVIAVTAKPKFVGSGFYETDYKPKNRS